MMLMLNKKKMVCREFVSMFMVRIPTNILCIIFY